MYSFPFKKLNVILISQMVAQTQKIRRCLQESVLSPLSFLLRARCLRERHSVLVNPLNAVEFSLPRQYDDDDRAIEFFSITQLYCEFSDNCEQSKCNVKFIATYSG